MQHVADERKEALERVRAVELSNMTLSERKKRYDRETSLKIFTNLNKENINVKLPFAPQA